MTEEVMQEVAADVAPTEINTEVSTEFSIPEQYQSKGWAENIKSQDDLYTQFDNLQGMIGKKSIPANDATDEQLDDFYTQLRPETADKYELTMPEGVEVNEEIQGAYKEFFHKNGFTQKQAQALNEFHTQQEMGKVVSDEVLDQQFDEQISKRFGAGGDEAIKIAARYTVGSDEGFREAFKSSNPEQMAMIVEGINKIHSKFSKEDVSPESGGQAGASQSLDEKISEANTLRLSDAGKDPWHKDHDATLSKIKDLSASIQRMSK